MALLVGSAMAWKTSLRIIQYLISNQLVARIYATVWLQKNLFFDETVPRENAELIWCKFFPAVRLAISFLYSGFFFCQELAQLKGPSLE
jgi:hypothetical protein